MKQIVMRWVMLGVIMLVGCRQSTERSVVVYTSLDQIFSEKILQQFERETGVKVKVVYDTEATKTVGLVNRILTETKNPQCDVFWNAESVRTVMLKRKGLLQPYTSPSASDIPAAFKDAEGCWAGFAARARVLICNTNLTAQGLGPVSISILTNTAWKGKVTLAYPLFGTTATHAAALFSLWGEDAAMAYYRALKDNGVTMVDGNATAKDLVGRGEVAVGFTDSDDANVAVLDGKPIAIVFPDQGDGQMGTLVIPNTVALIKNCRHPENGKKLIDFLLSREVEKMLAESGSAQMPVRSGIPVPKGCPSLDGIKPMVVDWDQVEAKLTAVSHFMEQLFVR